MGYLNQQQLKTITEELEVKGITFEPLKAELLDHMICDVELHMDKGYSFQGAWTEVKNQIPKHHFRDVQRTVMETLGKKYSYVRVFGAISVGLLALATLFKLLHLQGAGVLLVAHLVVAGATLILGSVQSVLVFREARGRGATILVGTAILAFIAGLCFKVLHLPGASFLLYFAVITSILLFPILSIYFYRFGSAMRDHLIIYLIRENKKVIEKTALLLIGFGLVFNYSSLLMGNESSVGIIFFVFSIILVGIYMFSLTWIRYTNHDKPSIVHLWLLISSSIAFILFMLPVVGRDLGFVLRNVSASAALALFILIVLIYYVKYSETPNKIMLWIFTSILFFYPFVRLGVKLEILEGPIGGMMTNTTFILGFLGFLLILLLAFRKEALFKALIILMIASHMVPSA